MIEKKDYKNWYESIIYFLTILSLFFTFTNFVVISAISTICIIFVVDLLFKKKFIVSKLTAALLLLFILCIISTLYCNWHQILDFGFYRRDGNMFITFTPLIVLSMCDIKFKVKKILKIFIYEATFFNLIGILSYKLFPTGYEYAMFFESHNGAGGFISVLIILNFYFILRRQKGFRTIPLICLLINLYGLYLTNSRGSILPLAVAFILVFLNKFVKKIDLIALGIVLVGIIVSATYILAIRGEDVLYNSDAYVLPNEFQSGMFASLSSFLSRSWTIVNRLFYLWPKAIYLFIKSPIFGVGFGNFNENTYRFYGISNVITFNLVSNYVNGSNHAHNSYLNFLAETGIVGFLSFMAIFVYLRRFIMKLDDKNIRSMLLCLLIYALGSGMFEHRLVTPAQMLPLVLIFGMAISNYQYEKRFYYKKNYSLSIAS